MGEFKKLKAKGAILFVSKISEDGRTVHGYNLASPALKQKTYDISRFDHDWKEDIGEITKQLSLAGISHKKDKALLWNLHSESAARERSLAVRTAYEKLLNPKRTEK